MQKKTGGVRLDPENYRPWTQEDSRGNKGERVWGAGTTRSATQRTTPTQRVSERLLLYNSATILEPHTYTIGTRSQGKTPERNSPHKNTMPKKKHPHVHVHGRPSLSLSFSLVALYCASSPREKRHSRLPQLQVPLLDPPLHLRGGDGARPVLPTARQRPALLLLLIIIVIILLVVIVPDSAAAAARVIVIVIVIVIVGQLIVLVVARVPPFPDGKRAPHLVVVVAAIWEALLVAELRLVPFRRGGGLLAVAMVRSSSSSSSSASAA
ncbi:unnamed protein product, partial [Ectocarpus sp. 12 AP-2014]